MTETSALLVAARNGSDDAHGRLFAHVYGELRRLSQSKLAAMPGATVSATGLVHEAYLKLMGTEGGWDTRGHFMCVAARAMRQILTDRARARHALKRGGPAHATTLDASLGVASDDAPDQVLAVDQALGRLEALAPDLARLVELRFFAGLEVREAAEALGVSERTAARMWGRAKAHLRASLA